MCLAMRRTGIRTRICPARNTTTSVAVVTDPNQVATRRAIAAWAARIWPVGTRIVSAATTSPAFQLKPRSRP
jgi:hypothetical protein